MIAKVLPEGVKEKAEACPVTYEDRPRGDDGLADDLLGLFEGASLIEEPGPEALPRIRALAMSARLKCQQGGDASVLLDLAAASSRRLREDHHALEIDDLL